MKKITKLFTMRRIIIVMSLALVYSVLFTFAKVYAGRSFIRDGEPSDKALVRSEAPKDNSQDDILAGVERKQDVTDEDDEEEPMVIEPVTEASAVTSVPETSDSLPTGSSSPEQLVDKTAANRSVMKLAAGTKVADIIAEAVKKDEAVAVSEDIKSSIQDNAEAKVTLPASESESKKEETKASKEDGNNKKSETSEEDLDESESVDEDESENVDDDTEESEQVEDESEQLDEDSDVIIRDTVEADDSETEEGYGFKELTDEEVQELLERLGFSSMEELMTPDGGSEPDLPGAGNISGSGSYKNEKLTIYDTSIGALRTDNAFDLVCEIVNQEVGDTFETEAIKAQAVAAYTYCKYYEQKGEYAELGTKSDPSNKIIKAVEAVDGLALYYDGKYIMTPFSASQGGFSASSKNVWGGDLPYLQSVQNDFDWQDTKYYGKVTTYTVEEVRDKIESKTNIKLSDNYSEWIRVLSNNDHIYVGQLSIDGHTSAYIGGKERTITGHIFRTYILNIRSTAFTVSYSNGVFTFTTYGYGHGVGLSQIGANLYAKNGYTYDQILLHYFTGVTLK